MTKEEQLQEIKEKIFQVQVRMYENEGVYCEEYNKFNGKGIIECNEIKRKCYEETIWRMQDYYDVLQDEVSENGLNYTDYSWLN